MKDVEWSFLKMLGFIHCYTKPDLDID